MLFYKNYMISTTTKTVVRIRPDDYACIEPALEVDCMLTYLQTNRGGRSQRSGRTVPDGGAAWRAAKGPAVVLRGVQVPAANRTRVHLLAPHFLGYLVKQLSI